MKKLFIGTNLKMFKNIEQTVSFLRDLQERTKGVPRSEMCLFVIPSYTALESATKSVSQDSIKLGAQNMHWESQGPFTGEISPLMLKELHLDIIEVGHSERRQLLGETDYGVNKKVLSACAHGFTALLCVGETGEQKDAGLSEETLATQLKIGLLKFPPDQLDKVWIAYEPAWAIGATGIPASPEYANAMHKVIKQTLKKTFGDRADTIPVLYGGSVNYENSSSLIVQEAIDGLFIGRAAWEAEAFTKIIDQVLPLWKTKILAKV
ncbi:MAG: triose-phosphate isomerase [Treponemataceae bacterium]